MAKYTLQITRTTVDVGYVTVEAKDENDALRMYWEPDIDKGEDFIFDCDIEWDEESDDEYSAEVVSK